MRKILFLTALFGLAALGGFISPAAAAPIHAPGQCADGTTDPNLCQFWAEDGKRAAPAYDVSRTGIMSQGIRLQHGYKNVLFDSYSGLQRYVSNNGTYDLFVPQGHASDFLSFLTHYSGASSPVTWAYAVPNVYSAIPVPYADCTFSADTSVNASAPIIPVPYASALPSITAPSATHSLLSQSDPARSVTVGSLTPNAPGSIIQFKYDRENQPQDCIFDNEENKSCTSVHFVQNQMITFTTAETTNAENGSHDYIWSPSNISQALNVKKGTGSFSTVSNCSDGYPDSAPPINGVCGSAMTSGIPLTTKPAATPPSTYLCAYGNTTDPVLVSGKWTWTCRGVGTGATDSATCRIEKGCPISAVTWAVESNSCSGTTTTSTGPNSSVEVTASGATPGKATFKCNEGTLEVQPGAACGTPCPASTSVNWTAGASCTGTTSAETGAGATISVTATGTNTGNATFKCNNGNLAVQSGAVCGAPCPAASPSWTVGSNTCTGNTGTSLSSGSTKSVTSSGTNLGSATFQCNNGTLQVQSGATCAAPASCLAESKTWTVGGATCVGPTTVVSSGSTTMAGSTNSPNTGWSTYLCTNGSLGPLIYSDCIAGCSPTSKSWTVGGVTCSGTTGPLSGNGSSSYVTSTNGKSGNASFACNNGVLTEVAGATCTPPSCAAQSVSWSAGGYTCTGSTSSTLSSGSTTAVGATGTYSGSANFACNSGTLSVQAGATCAPASCTTQTKSWSNSATCSASVGGIASGGTTSVSSSNGNLGSATFGCTNGTFSLQSSTCAAPAGCGASSVGWSGSAYCSGTTSAVGSGSYTSASSSNGNIGSISYYCNNGSLSAQSSSCAAPAACGATTVGWSGSASCTGGTSWVASGGTTSASASNGNTGSASYSCYNGSLYYQSGSCTAPPGCASTFVRWWVGGIDCTGYTGAVASGQSTSATDTGLRTGTGTYTCSNGTLTNTGGSCANGCAAGTVSWSGSGATCSASVSASRSGTTKSATSTNGISGSATFVCNAQTYVLQSGSCTPPGCGATAVNWYGSGGEHCTGTTGAVAHGQTASATDYGLMTGSGNFSCNSGSLTFSSGTCRYPCWGGMLYTWTVGANTCSATPGQVKLGATTTISSTNGHSGTATLYCYDNAGTGILAYTFPQATCN